MANELLTREDIVRAKQNVDAHDKYLDGNSDETVRLPSGKVIKTRAGVEKEIKDKFPNNKAGMRNVGTQPGDVIEMTSNGIGGSGIGATKLPFNHSARRLSDYLINGLFAINYDQAASYDDMPVNDAGVLQNIGYDSSVRLTQIFIAYNSHRTWVRNCINLGTDNPSFTEWGEQYHSRNATPYTTTTATAANVVVTSTGELQRSTSSRLFKSDINEIEIPDYRAALRAVKPISYRSTSATADRTDWHWYSFIAEDLANVDPALVNMSNVEFFEDTDEDGKTFINTRQLPEGEYVPDGLNLNGIVTLMARINQYMLEDIEDLEKEKTQLKTRMTKLENRLTELEKLLPAS